MNLELIIGILIIWAIALFIFIAAWHSFFTNEEQ